MEVSGQFSLFGAGLHFEQIDHGEGKVSVGPLRTAIPAPEGSQWAASGQSVSMQSDAIIMQSVSGQSVCIHCLVSVGSQWAVRGQTARISVCAFSDLSSILL